MENINIQQLMTQGGIALVSVYACFLLYRDMKENNKQSLEASQKREEKLMQWLTEKNQTDAKIANTLDEICDKLSNMDKRITCLEEKK